VVKATGASSAPAAGPPPSGKHVAGPNSKDMGPEAMRSNDPSFWLSLGRGVLHDQLAIRGYKNETMTAYAFGRLSKQDLVALILALPPPPKKP
jgi:hypothetical protein